jgi:DNA-binding transcriptional MocR family regulator
MYLEFASGFDASEIARRAMACGVITTPLDQFYHGVADRQGLVLGYGGLTLEQIAQGARILRHVIA